MSEANHAASPGDTVNTSNRAVLFVVPGDMHITTDDQKNYRDAVQIVDEIEALIRPDFVQFVGDNAQEAQPEQFALFRSIRDRLTVPSDVMVGDHDVHEDPNGEEFQRQIGETYGVRTFPGVRFIHLNTQQAKPMGLSDAQIEWFRGQTDAAQAAGEQVVVFQHNYPYQIWETFDGPGVDDWRAIGQTRRIAAIVCGHTHYFQEANDGRNLAIAARSIGDPEGGAPGYLVGCLQGDDLAFAYRTIEERDQPFVLVTHPREALLATGGAHVLSGDDRIRVFVRSASPVATAQWIVDGRAVQNLTPVGDDFWEAPLPLAGMAKGAHFLAVEIVTEDGQSARREQGFLVDETGRYTAVPTTRPAVSETQFC